MLIWQTGTTLFLDILLYILVTCRTMRQLKKVSLIRELLEFGNIGNCIYLHLSPSNFLSFTLP
jgi:hypothetical protein